MLPSRRSLITRPGWLVLGLVVVLGLGAINSQNNLLFFLLGFSLALVMVSGVMSGSMMLGMTVQRERVPAGRVGEPLLVRYRVTNTNRIVPAFGVVVREVAGEIPGQLVASVRHLRAGESATVTARVMPTQRGVGTLELMEMQSSFPLGIVRKVIQVRSHASVLIRPAAIEPGRIEPSGQDVSPMQPHRAESKRSAGGDFFGLREYRPGDPLRFVEWKASARTEGLIVREHVDSPSQRLWVELDPVGERSASDEDREAAISRAAGAIERGLRRDLAVGLSVPRYGVVVEPGTGSRHAALLLDELARIDLSNPPAELEGGPPAAVPHRTVRIGVMA